MYKFFLRKIIFFMKGGEGKFKQKICAENEEDRT